MVHITSQGIVVHGLVPTLIFVNSKRFPPVEVLTIICDITASRVVIVEGHAFIAAMIRGAAAIVGILVRIYHKSGAILLRLIELFEESLDVRLGIIAIITLIIGHIVLVGA